MATILKRFLKFWFRTTQEPKFKIVLKSIQVFSCYHTHTNNFFFTVPKYLKQYVMQESRI